MEPKHFKFIISKCPLSLMEYHFLTLPSLFTLILFLILMIKIKKRTKINGPDPILPPGPLKLPLIGNLHNLIGSLPHRRLSQLAKKYGPVMHLQLGELSVIVVSAPETAKIVLKTHDIIFAQRPQVLAAHIMAYESTGIAFSHGAYWRQLRRICTTELLSPNRVKSFRSIREEEVEKFIKSVSMFAGSPVNFSRTMYSLTYGITGRAAFGGNCKEQEEFIYCLGESAKLGGGFGPADLFPSIKLLHVISGIRPKLERLHRKVDMILDNIINQHKASRGDSGEVEDREDDLLDVLLNIQERGDPEFPLTINNIKAVIVDIIFAGSDTSATTVEWAMSEMIKNPGIMEKAQEEVRRVYNGTKGVVDEANLEELSFLKCVIKETLRLHPPGPLLLPRECQEQCKINGYDVPLKTKVIVNAWAVGRDPRHWTEPDRFYPERFLENPVDFKGTNFEFVPFGAGRRICPGMSFAMPNVELPLANLLYHFDWKVGGGVKNEDLDMTEAFGLTVRREQDLCLVPVPYYSQ